ncbi:MAG: hypothetical protein OXE03_08825 [Gammaproteobacteria bacterium]|nr:hypothetical protein [Gammaproteobacteria bacterium]
MSRLAVDTVLYWMPGQARHDEVCGHSRAAVGRRVKPGMTKLALVPALRLTSLRANHA